MRQFILPPSWDGGERCELTGRAARRLSAVLRLGPGDAFPALGPCGSRYGCEVLEASPALVVLRVEPSGDAEGGEPSYRADVRAGSTGRGDQATGGGNQAARPAAGAAAGAHGAGTGAPGPDRQPAFVLGVGLLKGGKLDEVARMAAEAGASALVPLVTARSLPMAAAAGRVERLRRVVAEALSQSGSPRATAVLDALTLEAFAARYAPAPPSRLGVFFHESPLAQASIHRYCTVMPDEVVACVGPEGGFSDAETEFLARGGFGAAWLGPTVLRAETAAVFALASLRIVCLERSSWTIVE